jgi:flagella basal body P-ring formation protein FlgA
MRARVTSMQGLMRCLILLAGAAWLGLALAATPIDIHLLDEIQVTSPRYTLADIATVRTADRRLRQRLEALVVGEAPRPGYVTQVMRHRVGARIEGLVPGAHRGIRWSGADRVRVRSLAVNVPAHTYTTAAETFLHAWLSARYDDFSWRLSGPHRDILVPPGEVALSTAMRPPARLGRRMAVWVDVSVNGAHLRSVPVWFAVSVNRQVLVTSRDLEPGSLLSPADVALEHRDIANAGGAPLEEREQLSGMRTSRPLPAGAIITARDLSPIPSVRKGQQVTVQARSGGVALTTTAIALTDGDTHDRIRVRTPSGHDSYRVVVVGAGRVSTRGDSSE